MKTSIFITLFLLLFPQPDNGKLVWKEDRKLQWSDFKGTPISHPSFVASTNTGLNFGYSYTLAHNTVSVDFSVESFFNPQKSWYLPKEVSPEILRHEQGHFDISELHARILRKRLSEKKFSKNVKREIEGIYLQVEKQRKAMQRKFDAETDHSRNEKKERFWENYIAQQLQKYNDWK